ncbi:MAG: RNA polymerase sigma-70 factor [Chitinophagales bacterium]
MTAYGEKHMNESDFKCLFDNYKHRVFGYVLKISHSPYVAEEITQEIFIKLWLCRDMLGSVTNLDAYVLTIARNKTLNYLRKAAHDDKILHELKSRMTPVSNNVEEKALLSDHRLLIQDALTALSPQRRLVYQLSRDQGLNLQEIADRLQVSPNTVKNHLVIALKSIRKRFSALSSVILLLITFIRL